MPKYRVESVEETRIVREQWIVAESEDEAGDIASEQDWREWSEVSRDVNTYIDYVEEVEP